MIDGKVQLGSYEKKDGSGKQNTTDIIVNQIEFLDSKSDGQAKPKQQQNESYFEDDVFTPVDDEDIPF